MVLLAKEGEGRMSFDRLAPFYRSLERVLAGGNLHTCRTAFLPAFAQARSVLLLGEGHGRFLAELLRARTGQEILVIDSSAGMLAQARKVTQTSDAPTRVKFVHADIEHLQLDRTFDAIATHFFLDCFPAARLKALVPKIASWSQPGASWHHADFQVPAHPLLALRARLVLALAYRFFRLFTQLPATRLVPPQPIMEGSGFRRAERKVYNFGLLYSELWQRE